MVEQKDVGIQLSWVPAEAAANMGHLSESVENLGATSHAQNRVVHDQWRTIAEEISRSAVCLDRLRRYAGGCIRRCRQAGIELPVEADDLVHDALLVLLAGRLKPCKMSAELLRKEEADVALARLISAISNTCRNLTRHYRIRGQPSRLNVRPSYNGRTVDVGLEIDVDRGIAELPPQRRAVAVACLLQDVQPAAYAATHGISVKTVRNHIHLAKRSLKLALGPDYSSASSG